MKFNNKTYSTKQVVKNILRIFDLCNSYTDWYAEANSFAENLSKKYNVDHLKVCGIIAALSPLKNWNHNKELAQEFLNKGDTRHTKMCVKKCIKILQCDGQEKTIADILNGNKITSFYLNIINPTKHDIVTVDRHAICIAVGKVISDKKLKISASQYEFIEHCYIIAAKERNVRANLMQSVTWEKWRRLKKGKFTGELF